MLIIVLKYVILKNPYILFILNLRDGAYRLSLWVCTLSNVFTSFCIEGYLLQILEVKNWIAALSGKNTMGQYTRIASQFFYHDINQWHPDSNM